MVDIIEGSSAGGVTYAAGDDFYDKVLNDLFLPSMADTVIYPNTFLKMLPRDTTRIEGKNVVFPIHTDDSTGVTALGADGHLPAAGTESYERYAFPCKHIYVRMKFDGITMDASKTQLASWLKVVESEAKGKANALARQRQRMYHNDGSGRLAEVAAASAGAVLGNSLVVRLTTGIESSATCTSAPTQHFKIGMAIAVIGDPTGTPLIRGIGKIVGITAATNTLDLTGFNNNSGVNLTAGDYIVTMGSYGTVANFALKDTAFRNEPMGLAGILSDTDPNDGTTTGFQGIDADAAANTFHRANILANGDVLRPLTLKLLELGWTTSIEIGDAVPTYALTSFGIVRSYVDLLVADRRFVGTKKFDGGHEGVDYNGIALIADRDMWKNRIALPDGNDFRMYVMADPQWMDYDGSIYHRLSDKDAYQATMYCRETMGCDTRDRHTLITDIEE